MAQCINKLEIEYQQLLEMTGLTPAELDLYIGEYYQKNGKCPTVDRFLRTTNTTAAFVKEYNLKKCGKGWIAQDDRPIDIPLINSKYRDIEVSAITSNISPTVYMAKVRAIQNRDLDTPTTYLLPTTIEQVKELEPEMQLEDGSYLYRQGNKIYRTNCKVTSPFLLTYYPDFATYSEALATPTEKTSYDKSVIDIIRLNRGKLFNDQYVKVNTSLNLPGEIKFYNDFNYPVFEFNDVIGDRDYYINSLGVLLINPNAVNNDLDLERIILQAEGFNNSQIETILSGLSNYETYEAIRQTDNSYLLHKANNGVDINSVANTISPKTQNNGENHLGQILDRLEELYGIGFIRTSTAELQSNNFTAIIPDATRVNAFIYQGQIYINMDNATSDSPIHELAHILLGALRSTNPDIYYTLVQSVEQLPDYQQRLQQFPNRTRQDVNEEIFVDLFAKHYTDGLNLDIDQNTMDDMEYEIEHNIDSGIFPNKSTTTINLAELMNKSLNEIMDVFGTAINRDTLIKAYNSDTAYCRTISNIKEELLKRKELEEYCSDGGHHSQRIINAYRRSQDSNPAKFLKGRMTDNAKDLDTFIDNVKRSFHETEKGTFDVNGRFYKNPDASYVQDVRGAKDIKDLWNEYRSYVIDNYPNANI